MLILWLCLHFHPGALFPKSQSVFLTIRRQLISIGVDVLNRFSLIRSTESGEQHNHGPGGIRNWVIEFHGFEKTGQWNCSYP